MNKLGFLLAALLLASTGWGQTTFNKYGPAAGLQVNTGATYQNTTGGIADVQPVLSQSPGLVLGGATGGAKGVGTVNATALYINGAAVGTSSGAVSSVGLTAPSVFGVTGSPVTAAGSLGLTFATGQTNNQVLRTGIIGQLSLSALTSADIPALSYITSVGLTAPTCFGVTGSPVTSAGSLGLTLTGTTATFVRADGTCTNTIAAAAPTQGLLLKDTGAATDAKIANIVSTGGFFSITGVTDAGANGTNLFVGTRSGSGWSAIAVGNSTDKPAITLNGPVTIPAPTSGNTFTATALDNAAFVLQGPNSSRGFQLDFFDTTNSAYRAFIGIGISTVTGAVATDFAISPGAAGSVVIGTANGGGIATRFGPNGNVTIAAPSSGPALTTSSAAGAAGVLINGAAGNDALQIKNAGASNAFGLFVQGGRTSGDYAVNVVNAAVTATMFRVAGDGSFLQGYNGTTNTMTGSAAGNVTINAPGSGRALIANGLSGTDAVLINGGSTSGSSFGLNILSGTNSSDYAIQAVNQAGSVTYFKVAGDGGVTVGSPTGGDKGLGSLNAQSLYVNGVAVSAGAIAKYAAGVITIGASTCTVSLNTSNIPSCTFNSTGNVTVNFTTAFTTGNCLANSTNANPVLDASTAGSVTGSVNVLLNTTGTVATNGQLSLVCVGS